LPHIRGRVTDRDVEQQHAMIDMSATEGDPTGKPDWLYARLHVSRLH
jgi:hypothetical protein